MAINNFRKQDQMALSLYVFVRALWREPWVESLQTGVWAPCHQRARFTRKIFSYFCFSISLMVMIFKCLPVSAIPWKLGCFIPLLLLFRATVPNINTFTANIINTEETVYVVGHDTELRVKRVCDKNPRPVMRWRWECGWWQDGQVSPEPQFTSCKVGSWLELFLRFFPNVCF